MSTPVKDQSLLDFEEAKRLKEIEKLERGIERYCKLKNYQAAFRCAVVLYQDEGLSPVEGRKRVERYRELLKDGIRKDRVELAEGYALLGESYKIPARDFFDDYMIALEWGRESAKRFWMPRRKVLLPVANSIQDLIDDKLDLLTISLPPGTGKSTLKIFLLSWLIGKFPDKPNLDSGHSGMMTQSTYDGVLTILNDREEYCWHDIFPEVKEIITNAKELTIDVNKKHRFSSLTCRAIGASLTGATRCEGILTADDLISGIEEAMSMDRLDKKWDAYTNDLKSRKKQSAKELHIATRWSVHDVIGRLEEQYGSDPRARFIVIPALNADDESNFDYPGGVGFDSKYFHDMRDSLDDVMFKALFMNEPIEREAQLFHPDSLRRFYDLPAREPDAILAVCDTAEGGGDFTAMPIVAVYGNDHYMFDCVCSDAFPEVTDELCAHALIEDKVQQCQFESNSAGGRTADTIYGMVKAGNGRCVITKRRTTANKLTKIIVNSTWIKERMLFKDASLIEKGSQYAKFMQLLYSFSAAGKSKHDDPPDALAQYALFVQDMLMTTAEVVRRTF